MPTPLIDKPVASEPLRVTLLRTVPLALIVGSVVTLAAVGVPSSSRAWWVWAARVVAALWFTFGGHWVELVFLRSVQPGMIQQGSSSAARFAARVAVWLPGGAVLGVGAMVSYTAILGLGSSGGLVFPSGHDLFRSAWIGAVGFVLIECVVHTVFTALGRPSAWRAKDGRAG